MTLFVHTRKLHRVRNYLAPYDTGLLVVLLLHDTDFLKQNEHDGCERFVNCPLDLAIFANNKATYKRTQEPRAHASFSSYRARVCLYMC